MYLLEINQRPELMDSEKSRLNRHYSHKTQNDWMESKKWPRTMVSYWWWNNISFVFWMYLSSIAEFNIQKKLTSFGGTDKKSFAVEFWLRSCLELSNYNFDRNLSIYSGSFCYFCQKYLYFHVISNYFNFIDRQFIVKW